MRHKFGRAFCRFFGRSITSNCLCNPLARAFRHARKGTSILSLLRALMCALPRAMPCAATCAATCVLLLFASLWPVHAAEGVFNPLAAVGERDGPVLPATTVLLKRAGPRSQSDVLRLGVAESGYPPLEIVTNSGDIAGITADYAALIGQRLKKRVEVVTARNFAEVIEMLKRGEVDMIGSMSRTPERDTFASFSAPYLFSTPVVIQRRTIEKGDNNRVGTTIAVEAGSAVIEFIKRDFPGAKIIEQQSTLAALQLVVHGQADSYVGELTTAAYLMETRYLTSLRVRSAAGFSTGDLRFAVSNTRPELARSIDLALAAVAAPERDAILRRWLPFATLATAQSTRMELTQAERAWLKSHPVIRLGAEPVYPPFSLVQADGKFTGLAADYLTLIAERTGLNIKLQPGLSWTEILAGLKNRSLDITPAVIDTPERRTYLRFAGPVIALPTVFVAHVNSGIYVDGLSSLSGKRMALIKNGPVTLRIERDFPGIVPVYVTSTVDALATVAAGEADIAVSNINFITHEIEDRYLGTLRIAGTLADSPTELNIGVRSDWPELQSIVRKGLSTISRAEHEEIRQKWLSVKVNQGFAWVDVLKFAIPLVLAVLGIIAVILVANRRLRRQYALTKAAENQVAYQLALQSTLLDSLPMPVFVVDRLARYIDCNRAYETAFGVKREAIHGKTLIEWAKFNVDEMQRLHARMLEVLATGGTASSDLLVRMDDGRSIQFQGAARAFALPNGDAGGLVGTVVDVSEERARQQELGEARDKAEGATRAKSAFLATMSHEIRTPMNGVLGMLELLAHTPLDEGQRNTVAVAQESGRTLLTLLSDVLDLSKIEAGKLSINCAPASLRAVAESVTQTLANGARAKGLKVNLFIAPEVAAEHVCDSLRMRQILFNLLGNAIKFTHRGSVSLRITALHDGSAPAPAQQIRFEVHDTGVGIAKEAQAHLFAPFEQAEPSISRQFGGTGLGLAICRRLADLMGASLVLDSGLGTGTTVRLEATFAVASEPAPRQGGPTIKVLVLADDAADQATLTSYLNVGNFEAVVPSLLPASAQQLQQLTSAQRPQCALVVPALLTRIGLQPGELLAMLELSGAGVCGPAVVWLTEEPGSARHVSNQPILPSVVSALLVAWLGDSVGGDGSAAQGPASSAAPAHVRAPRAVPARRVLVAEDHPTNRAIVCRQLEMIGCDVALCGDGETAFAAWQRAQSNAEQRFCALVIDCHMPVMDGYELAARIRARELDDRLAAAPAPGADGVVWDAASAVRAVRVPIIALTADTGSEVRSRCEAAGMDDLLIKPVDIPTLRGALQRWLGLPGAPSPHTPSSSVSAMPAAPSAPAASAVPMAAARAHGATPATFHARRLLHDMGSSVAVNELMHDYVQTTARDIDGLRNAAHDPLLTRRIAHRIKGAARLVGAGRIEEIAAGLEARAGANSLMPGALAHAAGQIVDALDAVKAELGALREQPTVVRDPM